MAEVAPRELPKENLALAYAGSSAAVNLAVPPRPALEPPAQALLRAGVASTFLLEGPRSVGTDGRARRFRVASGDVRPDMVHTAQPRVSPAVHLQARFAAPLGLPLFPEAPLTPFLADLRLPDLLLQAAAAGEPQSLPLGPVEGLSARLERLSASTPFRLTERAVHSDGRRHTTTTRVLTTGKERVWTLEECLILANAGAEPVVVEVLDRPVRSTHEKVAVTQRATPEATRTPDRLRWVLTVPARGTSTLNLETRILAPKEGTVEGVGALGLKVDE